MSDILPDLRFYGAKRKWPKGLHVMPYLLTTAADEITRLRTALSEAEQNARRQALEAAAKTIEEGFDRGIATKYDMCAHKKFEWEDCESCAATAIRALIPSEPHDAEGRE